MKRKVECSNCGEKSEINVNDPREDLRNILCSICATAPKEIVDERARNKRDRSGMEIRDASRIENRTVPNNTNNTPTIQRYINQLSR